MATATIPKEIQEKVLKTIESFNRKYFGNDITELCYFAEFKGKFLYLKRKEFGNISPIGRLTYTGNMKEWPFDIFKWSSETYDPDEYFFPGAEHLDGTINGAMKAGLGAYPV